MANGGNIDITLNNVALAPPSNEQVVKLAAPQVLKVVRNAPDEASRYVPADTDVEGKFIVPAGGSVVIRVQAQPLTTGSYTSTLTFNKLSVPDLPMRWYTGVPNEPAVTYPDGPGGQAYDDATTIMPPPNQRCYFRDASGNCIDDGSEPDTEEAVSVNLEGQFIQGSCGPGPNFTTANAISTTEVDLIWTATSGAQGYRLFIYDHQTKITDIEDFGPSEVDVIEEGFNPGETYTFTISAICSDGTLGQGQSETIVMPATSPRMGSIDINPNPGNQQTNVNIIKPQGQEKQPVALVLTNSQGQIVLSKTLDNGQVADRTVLDLQKLPAGVYTLRVTTGGVTELKKLVVTH